MWTPSHVGIHGNEVADQLTRQTDEQTKTIKLKTNPDGFKTLIKEREKQKRLEHWINTTNNKLRQIKQDILNKTKIGPDETKPY